MSLKLFHSEYGNSNTINTLGRLLSHRHLVIRSLKDICSFLENTRTVRIQCHVERTRTNYIQEISQYKLIGKQRELSTFYCNLMCSCTHSSLSQQSNFLVSPVPKWLLIAIGLLYIILLALKLYSSMNKALRRGSIFSFAFSIVSLILSFLV